MEMRNESLGTSSTIAGRMTAKPVSTSTENEAKTANITLTAGSSTTDLGYPVADLVGRCFLRLCFWIELCTSWARRYQPWALRSKAEPAQVTAAAVLIGAPVAAIQTTVGNSTPTDN